MKQAFTDPRKRQETLNLEVRIGRVQRAHEGLHLLERELRDAADAQRRVWTAEGVGIAEHGPAIYVR
ncbi:MAG: hypothetical protein QOJ63_2497 [Solirubrobacteraceae bacterium]|nr:hypothetical protein [Solirubrobacteraceae bacterium]